VDAAIPAVWGVGLAVGAALLGRLVGFDRDRAFYPVILIVIGSYYDLFAVMGGSRADLVQETIAFAFFAGAAVLGFRTSLWIVAAALALHGIFDFFHHAMIANNGVPRWWPGFCLSYDLTAATCLAVIVRRDRTARSIHRRPTATTLPERD